MSNRVNSPLRTALLHEIAKRLIGIHSPLFVRVGIDGVDGAGKTTFADDLAEILKPHGREVIRASVDGFHNPREVRYQRGRDSAEGFFLDSYNYPALRRHLLDPLGTGGSGRFRRAIFDHSTDSEVHAPEETARPGAILVFDGIFLHRPELSECWDFSVFLKVWFDVSIPRGAQRGPGFGSPDPDAPGNRRYIGGQKLYFERCHPERLATIIVDNEDLTAPKVLTST